MAFTITKGGLLEPKATTEAPGFKPTGKEAVQAQLRAEAWASWARKRDNWIRKQRAAGKLP